MKVRGGKKKLVWSVKQTQCNLTKEGWGRGSPVLQGAFCSKHCEIPGKSCFELLGVIWPIVWNSQQSSFFSKFWEKSAVLVVWGFFVMLSQSLILQALPVATLHFHLCYTILWFYLGWVKITFKSSWTDLTATLQSVCFRWSCLPSSSTAQLCLMPGGVGSVMVKPQSWEHPLEWSTVY